MATKKNEKITVNKIMVPTDFSEISLNALDYAAMIARDADAEILLLHVFESYDENTMLKMRVDMTEIMEKGIQEKFNEIKIENRNLLGVRIKSKVVTGKIYSEISRVAEEEDVKLIVMGTHGVSGVTNIGKYIMGSNSYRVIQNAPCPIITMREDPWKKSFKDILLPIDSTKHSEQKVEIAIRWAKFFKSTIHILAVTAFWEEMLVDVKKIKKKVKEVEKQLSKSEVKYTAHIIRHQAPSISVMEYGIKIGADLIMIVTGQESQLGEMFFGSTARNIVSESNIPVLSVHTKK